MAAKIVNICELYGMFSYINIRIAQLVLSRMSLKAIILCQQKPYRYRILSLQPSL